VAKQKNSMNHIDSYYFKKRLLWLFIFN